MKVVYLQVYFLILQIMMCMCVSVLGWIGSRVLLCRKKQARSEGKAITQQNLAPEMFGLEIQALKLIVLS